MEKLRPFSTKISFIRLLADMQVCSTYKLVRMFSGKLCINQKKNGRMLDVGCGSQPYLFLFEKPYIKNIEYVGQIGMARRMDLAIKTMVLYIMTASIFLLIEKYLTLYFIQR